MSEFSAVLITELVPKPSAGLEWIELYNPNQTAIDLTSWTLYDELSQPSLIYTFDTFLLNPHETMVVEVSNKLNNSADGVVLKNQHGDTIDRIAYDSTAPTDQSYARLSLTEPTYDWQETSRGIPPIDIISPTPISTVEPTSTPKPTSTSKPSPTTKLTTSPTPSLNPTITTALTEKIVQAIISQPPIPSPILEPESDAATWSAQVSPVPTSPTTRQVYFPDHRNPDAALNVIIGGLILTAYNGFLIWFDWQQSLTTTL